MYHGFLFLDDFEGSQCSNLFWEMDIRILFEVVENDVDIEHVDACFLLFCQSQFWGKSSVFSFVEDLADQLHQFQARDEVLGMGSIDSMAPEAIDGGGWEHGLNLNIITITPQNTKNKESPLA